MARFLLRVVGSVFAVLLLFGITLFLSGQEPFRGPLTDLTASADYAYSAAAEEVLPHIQHVQTQDGATKLIVGDSVCAQIFNPFYLCNTDYSIDGSNAGVTLAGYSVLADQFLQNHPDATDVYVIMAPETFSRGFDESLGYQYAVMPFSETGLLSRFDSYTRRRLDGAYGVFASEPITRLAEASPLVKKLVLNVILHHPPAAEPGPLPPLAVHSLEYMSSLCEAHGARFHLLCTPISDSDERAQTLDALEQAFREQGIYDKYSSYFTYVYRYPADAFEPDGIHFSFTKGSMEDFADIIKRYQQDTGLFPGIVTSYD